MTTRRLRLAWWVSWTAFLLGVAASVAANVAHAEPMFSARLVAAWPSVALLLTVEMLSRVPAPRQWWFASARYLATVLVALVAAIASYRHMAGLTLRVGEDALTAYTLPLSVDGTIVVASMCLLALSDLRRRSDAEPRPVRAPDPAAGTTNAVRSPWPVVAPAGVARLPLVPATPLLAINSARTAQPQPAAAWPGMAPAGVTLLPLLPAAATVAAAAAVAPPAAAPPPTAAARASRPDPDPGSPGTGGYDQAQIDARKDAARRAYRDSRSTGSPLSGLELGTRFGRSERWGRERIAEVKAADDATIHIPDEDTTNDTHASRPEPDLVPAGR